MVLGLALFATMATAQTNDMRALKDTRVHKDIVQRVEKPAVDYKASIFTKAVGDTITGGYWNFDDLTGIVYGNNGKIVAGDSVYKQNADSNYRWIGEAVLPHNLTGDAAVFMLIPDSSYFRTHASTYSGGYINQVFGGAARLAQFVFDGTHTNFMFIAGAGVTYTEGLQPGCFVKMPAVANPQVGSLYEVRFRQDGLKFVEDTWIDFKVGNKWYSVATNVRFIDATVGSWLPTVKTYTMPVEFGQQANLEIRFRYGFCNRDGRGDAYGYYYAFDDVAIVSAASAHWYTTGDQYVDGGYGIIPAGFNVPLSWYGSVFNDGSDTIASARATVYHKAPSASSFTALTSHDVSNIIPVIGAEQQLVINERGWFDSIQYPGWFGYATTYNDTTNSRTLPASYTKKGLPTDSIGLNKITVTGTVTGSTEYDVLEFDTIGYRVVDISGGEGTNLIAGYRWAHDNGVIPSNSIYKYGNMIQDGTRYVTEDGNYNVAGYRVFSRYTTPDVIPTDEFTGEPWVIRGMEIVPRTDTASAALVNSRIVPLIYREVYFDSSDGEQYHTMRYLGSEFTGLGDDYVYTVTANDVNTINDAGSGYIAPGEAYNAVNIRFTAQPELQPNVAYYVGYMMSEDGWFAAAQHLYGYRNSAGQTTRYNADPDLIDYYYQFKPYTWDVTVVDAFSSASGSNHPNWPLIRLIVGPREELAEYEVSVQCSTTDTSFAIGTRSEEGGIVNSCGQQVTVVENSDATFYVFGTGDSTSLHPGIIDEIIIDGRHISVGNEDDFYGDDYTIVEMADNLRNPDGDLLLARSYYIVTLSGVTNDRTISAAGHMYPFNLGIEGEAVNVALGLQPNPATSTVSINMRGVTGMVDCSIIDMSGRVVYSRTINAESSHTVDLSNIAAGAYFVRVTNDQFSKVEKLIVR